MTDQNNDKQEIEEILYELTPGFTGRTEAVEQATAQLEKLLNDRIIEELKNIEQTAPRNPQHKNDAYYFDIGYELVGRLKTFDSQLKAQTVRGKNQLNG